MRVGFESINASLEGLRQTDARHEMTIGQLAKTYTPAGIVIFLGSTIGQMLVDAIIKRVSGH